MGRRALADDQEALDRVKYRFVTAIEACIDAAQHVCSAEGWGPPDTNAEAMRILGRHGVLDSSVAESLAGAAGFRNILVHGYAKVDDTIVIEHLDRIDELRSYIAAVAALAASTP